LFFGQSVVRSFAVRSVGHSVAGRPFSPSFDRSIVRSIGRSVSRSFVRSSVRSIGHSADRSFVRSLFQSVRSVGRSVGKSGNL